MAQMLKPGAILCAAVALMACAFLAPAFADSGACKAFEPALQRTGDNAAALKTLAAKAGQGGLCPDLVKSIEARIAAAEAAQAAKAAAAAPPPPKPVADPCSSPRAEWPLVEQSRQRQVVENYRRRLPAACATLIDLADARIRDLAPKPAPVSAPAAPPAAAVRTAPAPASPASPAAVAFAAARSGAPVSQRGFRDRLSGGTEGPEMVALPAGSFTMGSPSGEPGRDADEGPQRQVTIGYQIAVGKYEVTRAEFEAFVSDTGRAVGGDCYTWSGSEFKQTASATFRSPGFPQSGAHPAVCVSWDDAKAYAQWLSGKTGQTYRLLSEAEWEYAARAGTTTPYYFGSDANSGCGYMNGADATSKKAYHWAPTLDCDDGYVNTAPVGSFKANAFGLHDMLGNAWEWVEDCYEDSYSSGQPSDGRAFTKSSCSVRVSRGGSWGSLPTRLRSAYRDGSAPADRSSSLGFRLSRTSS